MIKHYRFFLHINIYLFSFFESTSSFLVPSTSNFLIHAYWGGDHATPHINVLLLSKLSIFYIHYTKFFSDMPGHDGAKPVEFLVFNFCLLITVLIVNSMVQWNLYSCLSDSTGRLPFTCSSIFIEFEACA
jgi:hypothetical protein